MSENTQIAIESTQQETRIFPPPADFAVQYATRYITQVTYGRRMINSMYYPFMNYEMPEHVYKDANPRLKRLLGFLNHGPYG